MNDDFIKFIAVLFQLQMRAPVIAKVFQLPSFILSVFRTALKFSHNMLNSPSGLDFKNVKHFSLTL